MSARDRIIDAAIELAATDGVLSLGIDNVNRHAGVSKGAFFYHFKSKDEMILAMMERVIQGFETGIHEGVANGSTMLEAMVDTALNQVRERGSLIKSLVAAVSIDSSLAEQINQRADCWYSRACAEHQLGPDAAEVLHLLIDGLFMGTLMTRPRGPGDLKRLRAVIIDAVRAVDDRPRE